MKPIGLFFGKIFGGLWNWIKETAWVQPLLIVGSIFAIIFSIPTISEWVTGIAESINSPESYYRNFQMKLKGEGEGEEGEKNSDAQKLIDAMLNNDDTYGEKFMLVFVQVDCKFCKDAQPALKELVENTSRYYGTKGSVSVSEVDKEQFGKFKFYTIFTDETYDFPEDTTTTPFERFLQRNTEFLEKTAEVAQNSDYKVNNQLTDSQIQTLESAESNAIPTPTVIMYDLSDESPEEGISELLITVPGANFYDKAVTLSDAWMHRNLFELR
jgi:thiol-disulfide isomerase/thioredoxin